MTIHVVAVGRTWGTSWRWYKVCSHRRNPVIIDKYRNHIVQRVKVARIQSRPSSQSQGTSVDISYSILSNRCGKRTSVGNTIGVKDAVRPPGQSTGVYTTLPGQNAVKHCTVTIGWVPDLFWTEGRRITSGQAGGQGPSLEVCKEHSGEDKYQLPYLWRIHL